MCQGRSLECGCLVTSCRNAEDASFSGMAMNGTSIVIKNQQVAGISVGCRWQKSGTTWVAQAIVATTWNLTTWDGADFGHRHNVSDKQSKIENHLRQAQRSLQSGRYSQTILIVHYPMDA